MESPNRYGEMNVRPAKGPLNLDLYSEDEYGMNRAEEPVETNWSDDPRSEASQESHDRTAETEKRFSDAELKERILTALELRPDISSANITVEVESRVVTLRGLVEDREQKVAIERVIEPLEFISDIMNQLQIKSGD